MNVFTLVAGVASILGLGFSIAAFFAAKAASTAADNARKAILTRTVAEEIEIACKGADQLLDFVENDRDAEARLLAHQLVSALSEMRYRRIGLLDDKRSDELLTQRTQFQIIEDVLSAAKGHPIPREDRERRLLKACRRSSSTLREILGSVKQALDIGGET